MARSRKQKSTPGRLRAVAGRIAAQPVASGGAALMSVTAAAILVNALVLQAGPHPAPLFRDTRPVAAAQVAPAADHGPELDSIDDLVARTTGRLPPAVDGGLVSDIQAELKARGYYDGEVDGLTGPMTSAAIVRFEEEAGLPVTGEPTGDVLAALRAGAAPRSEATPSAPVDRTAVAVPQTRPLAAAPVDASPDDLAATGSTSAPVPPPPRARPSAGASQATADPETTEAVAAASPRTVAAGAGESPPAQPAVVRTAPPPPDPRLARVQEALDLLGYGPIEADGTWTPATRAAIRRFEENRGLAVTGELTPAFLDELVRIGGLSGG
jgi:peptidoglycan hydrolase-like protein with peptidoglycan-binding domain